MKEHENTCVNNYNVFVVLCLWNWNVVFYDLSLGKNPKDNEEKLISRCKWDSKCC